MCVPVNQVGNIGVRLLLEAVKYQMYKSIPLQLPGTEQGKTVATPPAAGLMRLNLAVRFVDF